MAFMAAPAAAQAGGAAAARVGAKKAAGGKAAARRAPAGSRAAQQREAIEQIKASRVADDTEGTKPEASRGARAWGRTKELASDQTGTPDWYSRVTHPEPVRWANAGGGFLLGLGVFVFVRTYLEGGAAGVKALLRAKFLNQTEG